LPLFSGFSTPQPSPEGTAERLIVAAVMRAEDIANWRPVLAGLCATLVGIGLARFAYTPLIPALIAAHWFSPSATVYLGAANLAGYLAGPCSRVRSRRARERHRRCGE
jgi:hypothetical protein